MTAALQPLAVGIGHLVAAADTAVDARAARELLSDVTGWLELRQPGDGGSGITYGPLASVAAVTREVIYDRLKRLQDVRREVAVPPETVAVTSLTTALNVLLAAVTAADIERFCADVERRAMVAAAISDLRGDDQAVERALDSLSAAAKDALAALECGAPPPVSPPLRCMPARPGWKA